MAYCERCSRYFGDEQALQQHRLNSNSHIVCRPCQREFNSIISRKQHYTNSSLHHYCSKCDILFDDAATLEKHYISSSEHFYCWACRVDFSDRQARRDHAIRVHADRYCQDCHNLFTQPSGLLEHYEESPLHYYCKDCNFIFPGSGGSQRFKAHCRERHVARYCWRCNCLFDKPGDLGTHCLEHPSHEYCIECWLLIEEGKTLKEHYAEAHQHRYCTNCNILFDTAEALADHYEDSDAHHYCRPCNILYNDDDELEEHYETKHWYCDQCKRIFRAQANLRAHLLSSIHNRRDHSCPASDCGKAFLNEGDLIAHWETGTCVSGIDRRRVNEAFVKVDSECEFLQEELLEEDEDGNRIPPQLPNRTIPPSAWTGRFWRCPQCAHAFRDRAALQAHLDSAAHELEIYFCDESFGGCDEIFATLSAFVRHVASEACGHSSYLDDALASFRRELFRPKREKTRQERDSESSPTPAAHIASF